VESGWIGTRVRKHDVIVSARRFCESLILLRMAGRWFGYSIKILSIFVLMFLDNFVTVFLRFGNHSGKLRIVSKFIHARNQTQKTHNRQAMKIKPEAADEISKIKLAKNSGFAILF
jgi:hypothetical protein